MYILKREPCTQEDEGREFYIGTYETPEEVADAIRANGRGYYFPSDFTVTNTVSGGVRSGTDYFPRLQNVKPS